MTADQRKEQHQRLTRCMDLVFGFMQDAQRAGASIDLSGLEKSARDSLEAVRLLSWLWSIIPGSWVAGHPDRARVDQLLRDYGYHEPPATGNGAVREG